MNDSVLPYLRDSTWSGWSQLAWTEPPGFDLGPWVPRMGFMVGTPGARRLLGPNETGGMTADQLAPIAIANLARWPAQWQVLHKAGGMLGLGSKAAVLEVRDELAAERLLVPLFVQGAQRMLMSMSIYLVAPMRGILRAMLAGGEPGVDAVVNKEKGDAMMAFDANFAAGTEAVTAACFLAPSAIGGVIECLPPTGLGRDRPYLPRMDKIVPKLEAAESQLWWDATPHRPFGTDGPFTLRVTLGVRGPARFHHLLHDTYQALRSDFGSLQRVAMQNLVMLQPEELEERPIKISGYRGTGAAEHLLVPAALMELHRRLVSPTIRVVVPHENVLFAAAAGAGLPDGELLQRAVAQSPWGTVTLSGGIHIIENGLLVQSLAPR